MAESLRNKPVIERNDPNRLLSLNQGWLPHQTRSSCAIGEVGACPEDPQIGASHAPRRKQVWNFTYLRALKPILAQPDLIAKDDPRETLLLRGGMLFAQSAEWLVAAVVWATKARCTCYTRRKVGVVPPGHHSDHDPVSDPLKGSVEKIFSGFFRRWPEATSCLPQEAAPSPAGTNL